MAEEAILGYLESNEQIPDSRQFSAEHNFDHDSEVCNVIKSLLCDSLIEAQGIKGKACVLLEEGMKYAQQGSPEVQLFLAVPEEGSISVVELKERLGDSYSNFSWKAKENKWVELTGNRVSRKVQHVEDKVRGLLLQIQEGEEIDEASINVLERRQLIKSKTWNAYIAITKGPKYAPERPKLATDLTRENIANWKELKFKECNINAKGAPVEGGHLHPLLKVRKQFKDIFVQMGFEEMPTNNYVESSFWNFDALFQPQQHPARDSHDTFFLKDPSEPKALPEDYVERVKRVHESGGYGSRGYNCEWKREEANKNLLRTHTTAVSARMLYALAQVSLDS
ncbi:unnamed protein product [Microthlaspi erraticum]|uniref:Phenylalanyl-tRNA synthetase domain-containing protein n=1 Tax=Microthlaspi erraticum TaxID=1685480 RepID=A0A6D2HMK9_9BRAS|nr:unnamed protein product [Microthlaspi erraticum]CAA7035661.1 unnamed protein product [Microthlaspi erraticum]